MSITELDQAYSAQKYETARRIGCALLSQKSEAAVVLKLHDALVKLADFTGARQLLEEHQDTLRGHEFERQLLLALDLKTLANDDHYRTSAEAKQGYSCDEYIDKYKLLSDQALEDARKIATSKQQTQAIEEALKPAHKHPYDKEPPLPAKEYPTNPGSVVKGRIVWPDGSGIAGVTITLGLEADIDTPDAETFISHAMHFQPRISPLCKLTATTDDEGNFAIHDVPMGVHEFLAVTLDPLEHALPTRFLRRSIKVTPNGTANLGNVVVEEWQSAPAERIESPHPDSLQDGEQQWNKVAEWTLNNPFYYDFPLQLLRLDRPVNNGGLRVRIEAGADHPFQVDHEGQVCLLTELPRRTQQVIAIYACAAAEDISPALAVPLTQELDQENQWVINTGCAKLKTPGELAPVIAPPINSVMGPDGVWRGQGKFHLPDDLQIKSRETVILDKGPLLTTLQQRYTLSNEDSIRYTLTLIAGMPLALVDEQSAASDARFEFSMREFSGGRSFLHWTPETGSRHWRNLTAENETFAQLQESIAWWIPPNGFACAVTEGGLDSKDYIGVFSRRRGEWNDRLFEKYSHGPIDADGNENWELEWPYPEMIGSTVSMITGQTTDDGDVVLCFPFFDGDRKWGMLISDFANNDGPLKDIGRLQHAFSSPRLQDLKDWHFKEADQCERPHLIAKRNDLITLRRKAKTGPFAGLWRKISSEQGPGPRDGVVFGIDADPLLAWKKRMLMVEEAKIRSKMTLLGRDWSDMYSPVGGRSITKTVEDYDFLAPSGVFSPDEERLLRAHFILMGHMFMQEDFMNWRYGGRNANFEADRVDIIGAIGLVFHGHPDSDKFTQHVIERTQSALLAYCTSKSGRWYENPACYYLHASSCRINLIYHLAQKGLVNVEEIPRLKEFLRWGINLLTPPHPISYEVMHRGDAEAYAKDIKVRKVPPVGDHAGIGRWLSEHYAFMGKLFLETDEEFGRELINAYFCANADGMRLRNIGSWENSTPETGPTAPFTAANFGNPPLFFCAFDEDDIPTQPTLQPKSRRLEGFGSVFRNQINQPEESYLLTIQGPGGYRYHRTQGSFIFFAQGIPLIFDGGEAGETWRHSTLSFHDVHMPLSAGHVERWADMQGVQFSQGVHPEILKPGDPVFLNDDCHHELVHEAHRRFQKTDPAVSRSFSWIDDDYLIIHDDLSASRPELSHWHLQVVGGEPEKDTNGVYRFPGRFGLDLAVALPDQSFASETNVDHAIKYYTGEPQDWFTMRHLQLTGENKSNYLAIIQPIAQQTSLTLRCKAIRAQDEIIGCEVVNNDRHDYHWFNRSGTDWTDGNLSFDGQFGAYLQKPDRIRLCLMASGKIDIAGLSLESNGANVVLCITESGTILTASGEGVVTIVAGNQRHSFNVSPQSPINQSIDLPANLIPLPTTLS